MSELQLSGCEGKPKFEDWKSADFVARKSKFVGRRDIYKCQHCKKWHIGGTLRGGYR